MLVVDGWMHKAQLSSSTDHCDCLKGSIPDLLVDGDGVSRMMHKCTIFLKINLEHGFSS